METESSTPMPAGAYYVGDLCYVVTEKTWHALPSPPLRAESWSATIKGQMLWLGYTAYGDGVYDDDEGFAYGVDSGSIGVMPIALCNPAKLQDIQRKQLGRVVTFAQPFTPTNDGGRFVIGHLVIDTRGSDEEDNDA